MRTLLIPLGIVALASAGCAVRSDNIYQEDVTKVLMSKADYLSSCHGEALKSDPGAAGSVVVKFRVEEDSGNFTNAAVEPSTTTAPESLQQCTLTALDGLVLEPGDNRPANATYEIVFPSTGAGPAAAPAAEPAGKDLNMKSAPDVTQ